MHASNLPFVSPLHPLFFSRFIFVGSCIENQQFLFLFPLLFSTPFVVHIHFLLCFFFIYFICWQSCFPFFFPLLLYSVQLKPSLLISRCSVYSFLLSYAILCFFTSYLFLEVQYQFANKSWPNIFKFC